MKNKNIPIFFLVVFLAGLIMFLGFSQVRSEYQLEISKGLDYILSQPQDAWATMALAAAGEQDIDLTHLQTVPENQKSATTYAKYVLALVSAGENPSNFGDEDYVEKLKSYFNNEQFGDTGLINDDVWAILALGALGQEYSSQAQAAKDYLLQHQNDDGGWGYGLSAESDTNSAASTIMALLEAGVAKDDLAVSKAVNYLKDAQNDDGGFPYAAGIVSDSCSSAWVLSSLYGLGQDPDDVLWLKNNKSATDSLLSLQAEDGGFWWQQENDNKFCAPYALLALLGKGYPLKTSYNLRHLRIQGVEETICDVFVNGGTALDLIIAGSSQCGYDYLVEEYPGLGLYLAELQGQTGWVYQVNGEMPLKGAADYYLSPSDEVLWHLFDFPPESGAESDGSQAVGLLVEIVEGGGASSSGANLGISFSLSPEMLDFGTLKPGESALQNLVLSNGPIDISLLAEVAGDSIFLDNLDIEEMFWQAFSAEVAASQQKTFGVKLRIPSGYSGDLGVKQGELTFWAFK